MPDENDVQPIYEKLTQESQQWFSKFLLYRNMKAVERSLLGAYTIYQSQVSKSPKKPYKTVSGAWKEAYEKYDWKFRAEQYDAALQAEQEERQRILRDIEAAQIEKIMTSGYAAKHKRVQGLSEMAYQIERSFREDGKEDGNIVYQWLTPDKVREYRGCLDDIAKELGERAKKTEVTGKDGGPIEIQRNLDLAALTDEELDTLQDLLVKAVERRNNGALSL